MTAHDELRARLDDYLQAVATYKSADPHDREEARYRAMHAARGRVGDVRQAEALLAEHAALLDEIAALRAERAWAESLALQAYSMATAIDQADEDGELDALGDIAATIIRQDVARILEIVAEPPMPRPEAS